MKYIIFSLGTLHNIHDPVQGKEKVDLLTGIHYHNVAVCDENYMAVFEPKVFCI